MTRKLLRTSTILALALAGWLLNGNLGQAFRGDPIATAKAVVGRPATPMSYSGVARRSTVRAVTPGVGAGGIGGPASGVGVLPGAGAGGVGGPASGVGVLPGAGAGQAGVGYSGGVGVNLGGPVNRVGVR